MHKSLSVRTNRLLIVLWAAGVLAFALFTRGTIALPVVIGAACGVVAGLLQRTALRSNASAFAETATALDVRHILTSSRSGKTAISVGWICALVLLVIAILFRQNSQIAASWFAGYLAFMLFRDAIAYSALRYVLAAAGELRGRRPTSA